ncbi:YybS family protein [Methylotetracoccus oryzae]|uniref:hypothetical protein n=1 Tax=Methylotetracoccus oryzae TaxID=1919059 RepID=UPI00111AFA49|nr:hypothetical protein [Methylotetracoccus oryzae]
MLLRAAAYALRGRVQASVVVLGFALLSLFFPLVGLLSSASVALVTLRKGSSEGLAITGLVSSVVGVIGVALTGSVLTPLAYAGMMWVPAWLVAVVLRVARNFGWATEAAGALGLLAVGLVYALVDDPAAMWAERFRQILEPLTAAGSPPDAAPFTRLSEGFAPYLTGLIAAGSVLSLILSLVLARWWQARLFNPGGFGAEFTALRMHPVTHYLALVCAGAAVGLEGRVAELFANLLLILGVLFVILGFAILHRVFASRPGQRFWLVGIYVLALFVPQMLGPLALLGVTDLWMDWRRRWLTG